MFLVLVFALFLVAAVELVYANGVVVIDAETAAVRILDEVGRSDGNMILPDVVFVVGGNYVGVEMPVTALRVLSANLGRVTVTDGRFSAFFTHEEIDSWELAGNAVINLSLYPVSGEFYRMDMNVRNGMLVTPLNLDASPIYISMDITGMDLTDELRDGLMVMHFYEEPVYANQQPNGLFIGEFSDDGNSLVFMAFASGVYGIVVIEEERPAPAVRLHIDSPEAFVGGRLTISDVSPFIDPVYGRTMVPLRVIAEAFGVQVEWLDDIRSVLIVYGGLHILLPIDVPLPGDMGIPVIVDGRTFVPLRYISELLGAEVTWDETNRAVNIYR